MRKSSAWQVGIIIQLREAVGRRIPGREAEADVSVAQFLHARPRCVTRLQERASHLRPSVTTPMMAQMAFNPVVAYAPSERV